MTEKIFAKGIYVKEFGNYGNIKLSININDIFDKQNQFDETSGWGNFIIKKSKNNKLYIEVNTWKPNEQNNNIKEFVTVDYDALEDEIECPF